MKKKYIQPTAENIALTLESIIADSIVSEPNSDAKEEMLSNRSSFGDDWDDISED